MGMPRSQPYPGPQALQLFPESTRPATLVDPAALASPVAGATGHTPSTSLMAPQLPQLWLLSNSPSPRLSQWGPGQWGVLEASNSVQRLWGWEEEGTLGHPG